MDITFINVGYGESVLISRDGFLMLIDGGEGDENEYKSLGRIRCVDYLNSIGVRHIDVMVNTHIHADHTSGLLPVAQSFSVGEFWTPFLPSLPSRDISEDQPGRSQRLFARALNSYRRLLELFNSRKTPVLPICSGKEPVKLPCGIVCDLLGPKALEAERMTATIERAWRESNPVELLRDMDARMNNLSIVTRLCADGKRALLVGDCNRDGFARLDKDDGRLRAEVFKVGHHGQIDCITNNQLLSVAPEYIIITASSDRRYNSAHPNIIDMAKQNGIVALFTDNLPGLSETPHSILKISLSSQGVNWLYA